MKKIKKLIRKIKDWLIDKLGGYTKEDMNLLYESQVVVRRMILGAWAKVVQELCRRSDNTYYDWACDYCETECDKRNSWCERFTPEPVNGFPHIDTNALDERQQNNE